MPKQAKRRSKGYWKNLVSEYEGGGGRETQKAFARRKKVNYGTFQNWVSKLRRELANGKRVRFVEVTTEAAKDVGHVEIDLVGRWTIRFAGDESAERISDVVSELSRRLGC